MKEEKKNETMKAELKSDRISKQENFQNKNIPQ